MLGNHNSQGVAGPRSKPIPPPSLPSALALEAVSQTLQGSCWSTGRNDGPNRCSLSTDHVTSALPGKGMLQVRLLRIWRQEEDLASAGWNPRGHRDCLKWEELQQWSWTLSKVVLGRGLHPWRVGPYYRGRNRQSHDGCALEPLARKVCSHLDQPPQLTADCSTPELCKKQHVFKPWSGRLPQKPWKQNCCCQQLKSSPSIDC